MESPPTFSTHSEAPLLSEDSGLLINSGSFSSDSASGWHHVTSELQESDYDEKSLSLSDSTGESERLCRDNFNTVKKGPAKLITTTIEPPPEFQDKPATATASPNTLSNEAIQSLRRKQIAEENAYTITPLNFDRYATQFYTDHLHSESRFDRRQCVNHRFTTPRILHLSPCRARPSSRSSLSSRLSSSHNSLTTQFPTDDSSFITQAISHDTLPGKTSTIPDMYTVPFDSDIYAVPIDTIKPGNNNMKSRGKKAQRNKRRSKGSCNPVIVPAERNKAVKSNSAKTVTSRGERHLGSIPSSSAKKIIESDTDSLHMTLREMRKYLHTLYSSSSESEHKIPITKGDNNLKHSNKDTIGKVPDSGDVVWNMESNNNHNKKSNKNISIKTKKQKEPTVKETHEPDKKKQTTKSAPGKNKSAPVRTLTLNLKQSFCNLFRWRRQLPTETVEVEESANSESVPPPVRRALPPLPITDFATSIQKVKDYGWYWGPISVETAEKILSNEPDGSFIVRDSSDDHYIFTLTFKLNGMRHVRIEHDQGNFCFGGCTMFKAQTIVQFIENAVETSRSGRYLFFLNLRPVLGPVRVQLLYPVSRFKRTQSLQHMCRFVILKHVRRDLVNSLPLPRRLLDYLNATHYFSEQIAENAEM